MAVYWRGAKLDKRTKDMMVEVAKRTKPYIRPTQGGFSNAVFASAGTHGGAAIDISCRGLSKSVCNRIVKVMREVGFAAWRRDSNEGPWARHIHAVPIGGNLSSAAEHQVDAHMRGRNGLENNWRDKHRHMRIPRNRTWEKYKALKRKFKYGKWRNANPGTRILSLGVVGSDVKFVQKFIGSAKVGSVDGKFGPVTERGVRWYQDMRGITVDGIVGAETWSEILGG